MQAISKEALQGKAIVFYDGTCGFCQASVQFALKHNSRCDLYFATLQSEVLDVLLPVTNRPNPLPDSVVFYEDGALHTASEAVLHIARHLDFPFTLLYYFRFIPLSFRNLIYSFIAKHRYMIAGKNAFCVLPSPEERARFIA